MKTVFSRSSLPWLMAVTLLALLVILAIFQYRWLGEVSTGQRERMASRLDRDARGFARDFNRELTRIVAWSQAVAPVFSESQSLGVVNFDTFEELWINRAPFPELLKGLMYCRRDRHGLRLWVPGDATGDFVEQPWPESLQVLKTRLEQATFRRPSDEDPSWPLFNPDVPALVVPVFHRGLRRRSGPDSREHSRRGGPPGRGFGGPGALAPDSSLTLLVFLLEPQRVLEALAASHFGGDGNLDGNLEFHLRIHQANNPTRVVFEAGPPVQTGNSNPASDATTLLFGMLTRKEALRLLAEVPSISGGRRERFFLAEAGEVFGQHWRLTVTHPSGSLEAAVSGARRKNLAIGLGILGVLGATVAFLLVATRQAQMLARQQVEFVAGVTHELRTPLAAMRSAGENLADGVVRDPKQVARYGELIAKEGRRLSDMVEQVLEYAGIHSGRRSGQPSRARAQTIIDEALAENVAALEEKDFEVEVEVAASLPDVKVDPSALRRALANLVANAIKYGEREAWIAIRAHQASGEIRIQVEDHGPGIAAEDLPHLFEPFYRGRNLAAGRIPGSGLGLSLVRQICQAQGGRVTVSSREGKGSIFTLHLPPAPMEGEVADAESHQVTQRTKVLQTKP